MRLLARLSVARNGSDSRIIENADIEIGGVFALAVEPQAGGYLLAELHECLLGFQGFTALPNSPRPHRHPEKINGRVGRRLSD
jgi:hypothetical protein